MLLALLAGGFFAYKAWEGKAASDQQASELQTEREKLAEQQRQLEKERQQLQEREQQAERDRLADQKRKLDEDRQRLQAQQAELEQAQQQAEQHGWDEGQAPAAAPPAASGASSTDGYVRIEFIGREPPSPFTFRAASDDTNRVNGASAGIRFTGVNLPCGVYHLYVDKAQESGGGVARDTDLCNADGFIVLPSEIYTLRNRSDDELVSRNVRVD